MTCSASWCRFRVHPNFVCCRNCACCIHRILLAIRSRYLHSINFSPWATFSAALCAQKRESTFSISAGAVVDAELLLTQTLFFVMGTRQWTRLAGELCIEKVACPMWAFISALLMEIHQHQLSSETWFWLQKTCLQLPESMPNRKYATYWNLQLTMLGCKEISEIEF